MTKPDSKDQKIKLLVSFLEEWARTSDPTTHLDAREKSNVDAANIVVRTLADRIDYLEANAARMGNALLAAAKQFRIYQANDHRAGKHEKSQTNRQFAVMCEAAATKGIAGVQ